MYLYNKKADRKIQCWRSTGVFCSLTCYVHRELALFPVPAQVLGYVLDVSQTDGEAFRRLHGRHRRHYREESGVVQSEGHLPVDLYSVVVVWRHQSDIRGTKQEGWGFVCGWKLIFLLKPRKCTSHHTTLKELNLHYLFPYTKVFISLLSTDCRLFYLYTFTSAHLAEGLGGPHPLRRTLLPLRSH